MGYGFSIISTRLSIGMNYSRFMGRAQFGPAYQKMLDNDTHAPSSVDRVLTEQMIRLCSDTATYLYSGYTPIEVSYKKGSRAEIEDIAEQVTLSCPTLEARIEAIVKFTANLEEKVTGETLDSMQFGGTEEAIISRGSEWCTDIARVACSLCQVAGVPSRIVNLYNTKQAYSGHVIIEAYRQRKWGAVDSSTAVVYRHSDGTPASTWDLMNQPSLIERHQSPSAHCTWVDQFTGADIANYFAWQSKAYDYTLSGINDYCYPILEMSSQGWPGGLRWLHGEDSK